MKWKLKLPFLFPVPMPSGVHRSVCYLFFQGFLYTNTNAQQAHRHNFLFFFLNNTVELCICFVGFFFYLTVLGSFGSISVLTKLYHCFNSYSQIYHIIASFLFMDTWVVIIFFWYELSFIEIFAHLSRYFYGLES